MTLRGRDDRAAARARRYAPSSRASSRAASLVMMHPRDATNTWTMDRRSVSENFEERARASWLLHASLRSRWPCPFFIPGRLCARACDGAVACYVPVYIGHLANKNWSFFATCLWQNRNEYGWPGHFIEKRGSRATKRSAQSPRSFELHANRLGSWARFHCRVSVVDALDARVYGQTSSHPKFLGEPFVGSG